MRKTECTQVRRAFTLSIPFDTKRVRACAEKDILIISMHTIFIDCSAELWKVYQFEEGFHVRMLRELQITRYDE